MQAEPWTWEKYRETPWWQKALTLAAEHTGSIIRAVKIPGEFFPGMNKALDRVEEFVSPYLADLEISPLGDVDEFKSDDGMPPPVKNKSGEGPVFFGGVETMITVRHNEKGRERMTLERIDLLVSATPGLDPYFSYRRDGEALFGAGLVESMRFFIEIDIKGPRPARRQVQTADGKKMLIAQSANFLDTDPESYYEFAPAEAQRMKFSLTACEAGYYECYLRFFYRVAARELRQQVRGPIRLYSDGE